MSSDLTAAKATNCHGDGILTAKQAKERLKCSLSAVYGMFKDGELSGFRLKGGGKKNGIRIYADSINELMRRSANTAAPTKVQSSPPQPPPRRPPAATPPRAVQGLRHPLVKPRSHQEGRAPADEGR